MINTNEERQRIGKLIAEIRKEKGLSQVQLAELCGTHQGHIARIELGKYSVGLDTLANIAEALGCKIDITRCIQLSEIMQSQGNARRVCLKHTH